MSIGAISDPDVQQEFRRLREQINRLENQISGVLRDVGIITSHGKLSSLDFASSGHTGFASSTQLTAHTGDATIHFTIGALILRQAATPATDGADGDLWENTTTNPSRLYARIEDGSGVMQWVHLVKGPA